MTNLSNLILSTLSGTLQKWKIKVKNIRLINGASHLQHNKW